MLYNSNLIITIFFNKLIMLSFFPSFFSEFFKHILRTIPVVKISKRSVLWAESEWGWKENAPPSGVKSTHFPAPVSCHHKCCCLILRGNTIWQQRQELTRWGARGLGRGGRTEDRETRWKRSEDWRRILNGLYVTRNTLTVSPRLTQWSTHSHPKRAYSCSLGFWAGSDPDLSDCN